jgi:hypothetical protein
LFRYAAAELGVVARAVGLGEELWWESASSYPPEALAKLDKW